MKDNNIQKEVMSSGYAKISFGWLVLLFRFDMNVICAGWYKPTISKSKVHYHQSGFRHTSSAFVHSVVPQKDDHSQTHISSLDKGRTKPRLAQKPQRLQQLVFVTRTELEGNSDSESVAAVMETKAGFVETSPGKEVEVGSTNRVPVEWRSEVLKQLKEIIDPDLGADIVSLGFIQNLELEKLELGSATRTVVSFNVELTTPACPVKDQFKLDCERLVSRLDWVDDVDVTMTAQPPTSLDSSSSNSAGWISGMSRVGSIIAVSSCKGGVGKSTTAVNLAYTLQQALGASVGILDADVYGPSLPTMVTPDDDIVRFVGRQIAPLQRNGVKLMSFGYVNDGSAVMRGPMVTQLLDQFLAVTAWGPLDYLILDMPPGTGDIQLTLTQKLNITAAVIVTTPTQLSFADVVRGIEMFDTVNVPCIAVVENMAYYQLPSEREENNHNTPNSLGSDDSMTINTSTKQIPSLDPESLKRVISETLHRYGVDGQMTTNSDSNSGDCLTKTESDTLCDALVQIFLREEQTKFLKQPNDKSTNIPKNKKIRIFGTGHKYRLAEQYGIEHTFSLPLLEQIATNGDTGTPYVLENPNTEPSQIYRQLASTVVREVAKIKYGQLSQRPEVQYNKEKHIITVSNLKKDTTVQQSESADSSDVLHLPTIQSPLQQVATSTITPAELRRRCRCASCVEELTGRQILVPSSVSEKISPLRMYPTGNYALSVDWSDGHRSLYPYKQIISLVQSEQPKNNSKNNK